MSSEISNLQEFFFSAIVEPDDEKSKAIIDICLEEDGLDIDMVNSAGSTLMDLAFKEGRKEIVTYLANEGASVGSNDIYNSIVRDWDDLTIFLIKIHPRFTLDEGLRIFRKATLSDQLEVIKCLCEHVRFEQVWYDAALKDAVRYTVVIDDGREIGTMSEIADCLLAHGAGLCAIDDDAKRAYYYKKMKENPEAYNMINREYVEPTKTAGFIGVAVNGFRRSGTFVTRKGKKFNGYYDGNKLVARTKRAFDELF